MFPYIVVAIGGALGSIARMALAAVLPATLMGLPIPILCINVIGCFFMGVLSQLAALQCLSSPLLQKFLMIGILGGFTTFSAFALDVWSLWEKDFTFTGYLYITLSVVLSLVVFALGIKLTRLLVA